MVPYQPRPRHAGVTGWTLLSKLRYTIDSFMAFSDLPIAALGVVGTVCFLAFSGLAVAVFVAWYLGRIAVPGYTPIMLTILVSTTAILVGQAILGAYVWRTFENTKGRPMAIEEARQRFPAAADPEGART
jgi:hypothetical protein